MWDNKIIRKRLQKTMFKHIKEVKEEIKIIRTVVLLKKRFRKRIK